jgi:renalase
VAVIIVGAGVSGIACARVLADAGVPVWVAERGRVPGGRMATKRFDGRPADIGAGYFTVREPDFAAVVRRWASAGLAREWTDTLQVWSPDGAGETTGPMRWAAPAGLRSLAAELADGLDVRTGHEVHQVLAGPEVDGEPAQVVVLAMPGPQALRVLDPALTAARAAADQQWSPVLAATLRYPAREWAPFDGAFVNGDPVLATVFDDGARRGDGAPVVVAHTTEDFARRHLPDPAAAAAEITEAAARVLKVDGTPLVHVHRWTYAKPVQDGSAPFHLDDAGIGICGDAWGSPRVETAWLSGTRLGAAVLDRLAG